MAVSENSGTPKSSILIGFSIIFTIHFGVFPLFWKHPLLHWCNGLKKTKMEGRDCGREGVLPRRSTQGRRHHLHCRLRCLRKGIRVATCASRPTGSWWFSSGDRFGDAEFGHLDMCFTETCNVFNVKAKVMTMRADFMNRIPFPDGMTWVTITLSKIIPPQSCRRTFFFSYPACWNYQKPMFGVVPSIETAASKRSHKQLSDP